jgi:hypothetical protein
MEAGLFHVGSRQGHAPLTRERMTNVKVRAIHVIHSVALLAVVTQLVFAGLFLADTLQTSANYDALSAHRVPVEAHRMICFGLSATKVSAGYFINCFVTYQFRDQHFHAVIGYNWSLTFYVDPDNTTIRMAKTTYDNATVNINTDIAFAVLLLLGAALVTILHQLHLHRRRQLHHVVTAHHSDETQHWQASAAMRSGSSVEGPDGWAP